MRCMRKILVLMLDLVIFILTNIQANGMTSTSFQTSSLQTPPHHPLKLDNTQHPYFNFL